MRAANDNAGTHTDLCFEPANDGAITLDAETRARFVRALAEMIEDSINQQQQQRKYGKAK